MVSTFYCSASDDQSFNVGGNIKYIYKYTLTLFSKRLGKLVGVGPSVQHIPTYSCAKSRPDLSKFSSKFQPVSLQATALEASPL